MRVLLAEDHLINQKIAILHLKNAGCEIDVAENGIEAVELFKKNTYDLVLMDIEMPELDGNEATILIRKFEKNASASNSTQPETQDSTRKTRTPIVAITAHEEKEFLDKCIESGMDDLIIKPIKQENIIGIVEKWITKNGLVEGSDENKGQVSESESTSSSETFNYKKALDVFGNDKKLITKLLNIFVIDGRKRIAAIREAIDSDDKEVVFRQAHTLKGASASIYVEGVLKAAVQLEKAAGTDNIDAKNMALDTISREMGLVENLLNKGIK